MRLAYVCADLGIPVFGSKGCSIHVQEVIRALTTLGVQVELFTARPEGERPTGLVTIRLHPLAAPSKASTADREQAALAANRTTRSALEQAGPFELVYERYSLWSFAGMNYARAHGIPGLLEVNAPLIEEQAEHRQLVDRPSAEGVADHLFATATGLIAVSHEVAKYLERFPQTRGRIHVIPNGVNPERFPPGVLPSCPGPPGTFTIGFVGSLKPWHGLATLVEAFSLLWSSAPDTRLLIVGDGPERQRLMDDLSRRGLLEATHLTGAVGPGEIPGLLASMDVAAAPYPELPNFYFSPLKVYEYMAAGCPVVASRIGQLAELIDDGVNGLLCPPDDAASLAGAFARLRQDPHLRDRLARAARAQVLQQHTWTAVVRRILHLAGVQGDGMESLPQGHDCSPDPAARLDQTPMARRISRCKP
jgi:glycosyltransferase involved in cell wall biosynthesis